MERYVYVIAPLAGWLFAQGLKYAFNLGRDGLQLSDLVSSGGMPSSHSAYTVSLATLVGLRLGIDSPIFGLALALAGIVMYDAMGVRRTTGEQVKAIEEVASHIGKKMSTTVHISRGHTPLEVAAGALVGVVAGVVVYILL